MTRFLLVLDAREPLHIDAMRLAVFSWAGARAMDGDLVLRLADRSVSPQAVQSLVDSLVWLGVDWDEPERVRELSRPGRDDPDFPITHIVLNREFPTFQKLETLPETNYLTLSPILGENGQPLPQRGYRLEDFQEAGYLPKALFNYLLLLGWSAPQTDKGQKTEDETALRDTSPSSVLRPSSNLFTKWEVRQSFLWEDVVTSPITFDRSLLDRINQQYIQKLSIENLADLLRPYVEDAYGALPMSPAWLHQLTELIQPELVRLEDVIEVAEWAFSDDFVISSEAKAVLGRVPAGNILTQLIAEIAQVVLLDQATAQSIIANLSASFGVDVVPIVRSALVGVPAGYDLPTIMGLLGKQTTLTRLGYTLRQ